MQARPFARVVKGRPLRGVSAAAAVVVAVIAAAPATAQYAVSVVPSTDRSLSQPVPRDKELTPDQILDMVRRAVDLTGGMESVVPSTAGTVLLKPNIGADTPPRSGVITDYRVARAVAILVHEAAPHARILIAEGAGGWASPDLADSSGLDLYGDMAVDGFERSGFAGMVRELRERGIDIECFDLNFDKSYDLTPPTGGLATDEYAIAAAVMDADVWINLPVAKTHGAKITCCMKNHFGILPGLVYGWSKSSGTIHHAGIPHSPRQMDEAWIDLYSLTQVDYNVVDMIAGSEAGAFEQDNRKVCNIILAGRNPVATDLVVAKLMGFNPDDFEFAELAWQNNLGPRTIEQVQILGADVEPLVSRWKKAGAQYTTWGEWGEHANFGMGPRYWTLLGPLPRDHQLPAEQIAQLEPRPGENGWSEVVFFGHDKINLDKHYDDPVNCAVYGFTRFTMEQADSVRFWIGSDEDVDVWIDGEHLYGYTGRRTHKLGMDKIPGYVEQGEHRLLVRAAQGRGRFSFSFNVCEPIDDELYAGNRYPGVRYYVTTDDRSHVAAVTVGAEDMGGQFGAEHREANIATLDAMDPLAASRTAPDTILLDSVPTPRSGDLVGLLVELAGAPSGLDSVTLKVLGNAPFTMGHAGLGAEGFFPDYGPDLNRMLDWLGLQYAISYGYGSRESLKTIKGWLAQEYVPVTGNLERRHGRRWWRRRQAEWGAVTGYRREGDAVSLRMARAGDSFWAQVSRDWRGLMPGGRRENCPVVVAEPGDRTLSHAALVDSIASLALELTLREEVESDARDWGTPSVPAGLAAWDWWVIDWERQPLTPDWARQEEPLNRLERLHDRYPTELAESRMLAARFFAAAAQRTDNPRRRDCLQEAAAGFRQVSRTMEQLAAAMPENDRVEDLTSTDEMRLARIGQTRPLIRQARAGERQALAALAAMLDRPELPEPLEDPLRSKDRGVKLFTWRAVTDDTVHDLILTDSNLQIELLEGDEPKEMDWEVHAAMPQNSGWIAAVEAQESGRGRYRVVTQPDAGNGWKVVVRADDTWVRGEDNAPELTVWAVPDQ